jgi:hypothetical protein
MPVAWPLATAVKRVPSSTAPVSVSTTAGAGVELPQMVSGVAALAVATDHMAALLAARATAVTTVTAARGLVDRMARDGLGPKMRSREIMGEASRSSTNWGYSVVSAEGAELWHRFGP